MHMNLASYKDLDKDVMSALFAVYESLSSSRCRDRRDTAMDCPPADGPLGDKKVLGIISIVVAPSQGPSLTTDFTEAGAQLTNITTALCFYILIIRPLCLRSLTNTVFI